MDALRPMFAFGPSFQDRVAGVLRDEIRGAIAERRFSYETLAEAVGNILGRQFSVSTLCSYARSDKPAEPPASVSRAIYCALGKQSIERDMALTGYGVIAFEEPEASCPTKVLSRALPHIATVSEIIADGRVDHRERRLWKWTCDKLVSVFLPHSSAAEAV